MGYPRGKNLKVPPLVLTGSESLRTGGIWGPTYPRTRSYNNSFSMADWVHPEYQKYIDKGIDVGGSFMLSRDQYSFSGPRVKMQRVVNASQLATYEGFVPPPVAIDQSMPAAPFSQANLNFYGTSAVKAAIPTSPLWSGASFLGELREGLPKANLNIGPTGIADKHLAYQFGVKPLLADIGSVVDAHNFAKARMSQLERDSGKRVRRRLTLRRDCQTTHKSLGVVSTSGTSMPSDNLKVSREATFTRIHTTHVWFSGAFTYLYKPPTTRLGKILDVADKVYGVEISPELFWELSPYSWLADWVANIGDVISNMTRFAQDGLVMPYGYLMAHQRVEDQYTFGEFGTLTRVREFKQRTQASPFGFGINPEALDVRQWSILGALGLSKGSTAFKKT